MRAVVAARVAARVGIGRRQVEHRLGVALAAGQILVPAVGRHGGVALVVVIELERVAPRLPGALAVAALARQHLAPLELVRLVVLVAAAAQLVLAEVGAQALAVLVLVALDALDLGVFAAEAASRKPNIRHWFFK